MLLQCDAVDKVFLGADFEVGFFAFAGQVECVFGAGLGVFEGA